MSPGWMTAEQAEQFSIYDFKNAKGVVDAMMIGRSIKQDRYNGYRGDGHTMIIAPPGSGKGQGFVLPNCVFYQGSMVVIDPKGENAAMTARHREAGLKQRVHVIDPFGLSERPSARFNPLDWLRTTEQKYFFEDCDLLARALVASEALQYVHFHDEAVNLMRALILYLFAHEQHNLNLNRLYDLAFGDQRYWFAVFELMSESECEHEGIRRNIRSSGNWYLGLDSKAQDTHRSTVQKNLQWLAGLALPPVVKTSDFDLKQLKGSPMTVYLCIPGESRELYRPYVRCLITLALLGMYRTKGISEVPVQFMCDEFYTTIGTLPIVDAAAGDMRGYGARFAFIFQDLSQLQRLYPETWKLFESSCGAVVYMGAENENAEHVSKRLGEEEYVMHPGAAFFTGSDVVSRHARVGRRPLLSPQKIKELGDQRKAVVFLQHKPPLMCDQVVSYEDPRISGFLDENPMRRPALPNANLNAPMLPTGKAIRTVDDFLKAKGTGKQKIDQSLDEILGT
ncbi:MAG TPA: type IV secretory system conjugative DNA transfer family protein [Fimbriimonadaceae bacterium]|jgi:type IV secretion system protein VirD4